MPLLFNMLSRLVITFLPSSKHLLISWLQSPSAVILAMAPHSSTLAWKIPWMGEPGSLQSMGLLRVGHDWVTSLSLFTFMLGEGNGNSLQCSCLENPRDGGALWAAIYGVTQSRIRLKRLSSSSSIICLITSSLSVSPSRLYVRKLLLLSCCVHQCSSNS